MSILNNTSLGFNAQTDPCDCRDNEYCQQVAKTDNQVWQVVSECPEITGGQEKQPCESNVIGEYFTDFTDYDPAYISTGQSSIIYSGDQTTTPQSTITSRANLIESGHRYMVKFSVIGRTKGFVIVNAGGFSTGNANGNGNYSFVLDSGDDVMQFVGSIGEDAFDGTIINLFVICVRYSMLYTTENTDAGEDLFTYPGPTTICKPAGFNGEITLNEISGFVPGQTYRICFTLSNVTAGKMNVKLGETLDPTDYEQNGRYCVDLEYSVGASDGKLRFIFDSAFDGCISDITVDILSEIRAELYDQDGNIVEDGIETEQIENTLKITLGDVPPGCYSIGIADVCSNFKHQFYGNALDVERESDNINTETGVFETTVIDGELNYSNSITFKDAVCCNKHYNISFLIASLNESPQFSDITVEIVIGGTVLSESTSGSIVEFTAAFNDVVAGCLNTDLVVNINYTLTGPEQQEVDAKIDFESESTFATMISGQLCPEFFSQCLKVVAEAPCDTVLIKYRNQNDAFGFDYTSEGYRAEDGFYNQIRIEGKLWKAKWPRSKQLQKNSNGTHELYYSDIDKKLTLNTGILPEHIHDALSNAVEHGIVIINDQQYVCSSESYDPDPNRSSSLSAVELEFFVQQQRMVNTRCG